MLKVKLKGKDTILWGVATRLRDGNGKTICAIESIRDDTEQMIADERPYYRVSAEDNGPGIPDDLKVKLFDRLSLETTKATGNGFGLCLIKILVDDYGGKFWVEDRVAGEYSKGCRFVVMLPAYGERSPGPRPA